MAAAIRMQAWADVKRFGIGVSVDPVVAGPLASIHNLETNSHNRR
jgi:hypothetical protein